MKIYLSSLFLLICLLISGGCTSNKYQLLIDNMQDYLDTNGQTCLIYVENDSNRIGRDKEKYKARHRVMQKTLDEFKEK